MRHHKIAVLMIFGLRVGTAQIASEPDSNVACIEHLEMPMFPPLARRARVQNAQSSPQPSPVQTSSGSSAGHYQFL
jgi:hypothetical protein